MVMHLVADPDILEWRRLNRDKKKCQRYQGELRLRCARRTLGLLSHLPKEQHEDVLVRFGQKFCDPEFSAAEIEQLLSADPSAHSDADTNSEAAKAVSRCEPETCEMFRQRGVKWHEMDTSLHDLEQTVEDCSRVILDAMVANKAAAS